MCGRYANHIDALRDWADVLAEWPTDLPTRYNVAPSTDNPVATSRGWSVMRWGLVPHWAKQQDTRYSTINARAEKVAVSPAYRDAWQRSQRCLVPASGYYEWRKTPQGKQPWYIHRADGVPLMFAGVWDLWCGGATPLCSYTIITTEAVGSIAHIHGRMPLLLPIAAAHDWLHAQPARCARWLESPPDGGLRATPVSTAVNNPRNDGPQLLAPVAVQSTDGGD